MAQGLPMLRQGSELGIVCLDKPSFSARFVRTDNAFRCRSNSSFVQSKSRICGVDIEGSAAGISLRRVKTLPKPTHSANTKQIRRLPS